MATSLQFDPVWYTNPILQLHPVTDIAYARVTGFYVGNPPPTVNVQVEAYQNPGTVYYPWQGLNDIYFSNGRFSGWIALDRSVVGNNALQLHAECSDNNSIQTTSGAIGVGLVFLIIGQSLAQSFAGDATATPPAESQLTSIYFADPAYAGKSPTLMWLTITAAQADGPINFANRVGAARGCCIGFVVSAVGGTPVLPRYGDTTPFQYQSSLEGNPAVISEAMLLRTLLTLYDAGSVSMNRGDLAGIIMINGEHDSLFEIAADDFLKGVTYIYEAVRSLSRRKRTNLPLLIGPVGKWSLTDPWAQVRRAMVQMPYQVPGVIRCADRYDLINADGVHPIPASAATYGNRWAADFLHYLNSANIPGAGPFVASAKRTSSSTVVLALNLNGHAGVAAQNGAIPLTGFSLTDANGANVTITNATVSGSQVTLTYSGSPAYPLSVDYQPSLIYESPVSISIASPGVISWTGHGLAAGKPVTFTTTGSLPGGLATSTPYYVISAGLGTNSFEVSTSPGGAAVNTSGTQSGTQTAISNLDNLLITTDFPAGESAGVPLQPMGYPLLCADPTVAPGLPVLPPTGF